MRAGSLALFIAFLVVVSVVLATVASTLALARPTVETLDADLAAVIRADYSADPAGTRLAPLDERIGEAARQDENRLRDASTDVEIVPVLWSSSIEDSAAGDGSGATTATPGGTRTPSPSPTPTPGATPTSGTTPPPGDTPPPGNTPPPGDTPTPGTTPLPAPTASPVPKPTPKPTPTPTPAPPPPASFTFYLHNDPSPPTGDTASHATLPMNATAPTASTLYNYDTNRDASPGLVIPREGSQVWRGPVLASDVTLKGNVTVNLWSAMKNFQQGKKGQVTVYLRDFDGSSYAEIANVPVNDPTWQDGSSTWVLKSFVIGVGSHVLRAGHRLELKVVVDPVSVDDLWFAYDTAAYPSRINTE